MRETESPRDARRSAADGFVVPLMYVGCWVAAFVGLVMLVYGSQGEKQLNDWQLAGCGLLSFPLGVIALLVLLIAEKVRDL